MKTRISTKLLAVLTAVCLLLSLGVFAATAEEEEVVPTAEEVVEITEETAAPAAQAIELSNGFVIPDEDLEPALQVSSADIKDALNSGLYFKNGEFKILVLSDTEVGMWPYSTILKYIEYVLEDVKPDLVILNGDITKTSSSVLSTTPVGLAWICDLLGDIPFTITFGDLDSVLPVGKTNYIKRYMSYDNCLTYDDEYTISGVANHNLMIFNDAASVGDVSKAAFNLWMLDTNANGLNRDQAPWYGIREDATTKQAGYVVPSMMFTHMPLPEISNVSSGKTLIAPATDAQAEDSVIGQNSTIPPNESTNPGAKKMFQYIQEMGNVLAAVSGHDRLNAFTRTYTDGDFSIDFIQNPGMAFTGKGDRAIRGGRVITLTLEEEGVPDERDINGNAIPGTGSAPVVTYTTELKPMWDYFDDDNPAEDKVGSRHAFYMAGVSWIFGTQSTFYGWLFSLFTDKYDVAFSLTQWFGDTFNFML